MQSKHLKKILIVTPRFPYPEAGADEQDRAEGIRQLKRLGGDVRVIGKYFDWQDEKAILERWGNEGVPVTLIPYQKKKKFSWILDGAAAEYADPAMVDAVVKALDSFHPDLVWFDYTYLWPLYAEVKKRNIPIAVRSINVESRHFLGEDGKTAINYLKAVPKYVSELVTARGADTLFAITPKEEAWYRAHGATRVLTLPLRALPKKLGTHAPKEAGTLQVFFSGSTYTVSHNRRALEFVIKELAPAMRQDARFMFHVTGAKLPKDLEQFIRDNVVYDGFVADMDAFLHSMDIAVVPSFFGEGMQQKIFEPLARGFPTITHARGIADYDFAAGEEYIAAETADEYARALIGLASIDKRRVLSENCKRKSERIFSQRALDDIVLLTL